MYFPHPVLSNQSNPYQQEASYQCLIKNSGSTGVTTLSFEHQLNDCEDLRSLISEGKLIHTVELSSTGRRHGFFRRSAMGNPSKIEIPSWSMSNGEFRLVARLIAARGFEFRPGGVKQEWQDTSYEMLPGSILAIDEQLVIVSEDEGRAVIEVTSHPLPGVIPAFHGDRILLKLPEEAYQQLASIPESLRADRPALQMLQYSVMIEAFARIRYQPDDIDGTWVTQIKELAARKGVPVEEFSPDEHELTLIELADAIIGNPMINLISVESRLTGPEEE